MKGAAPGPRGRVAPRAPLLAAGVLFVSGCCGPCGSWLSSGTSGGPPKGGAAAPGSPPGAGESPASGGLVSPSSLPAGHPVFAARRSFPRPVVTLRSGGQWIAQLPALDEVFDAMPRAAAPGPSDGLAVCRLEVTGKFDDFRGPDVAAWLSVGGSRFDFWGPEDAYVSFFSIPRATWKDGEKLSLVVEDRDMTGTEAIGAVEVAAGKVPVSFSHAQMNAECRAWPSDVVEGKVKPLAARIAADLAKAKKQARPKPGAPEWGYAGSGVPELWELVDDLAAHVGYPDARVQGFGAELGALERDWTLAATRSVAEETARLPPASKRAVTHLEGVDVTVDSVVCDRDKVASFTPGSKWIGALDPDSVPPCFVKLTVTRTAPQDSVFVLPATYAAARFVREDGSEEDGGELALLDASGKRPEEFDWTPRTGESFSILLVPGARSPIGRAEPGKPVTRLLRFTRALRGGAFALLRLDG